ncbi:hypothetical protein Hdeb2414_s0027g00689521 [Helianthus debilis subsp. tardiflorus]
MVEVLNLLLAVLWGGGGTKVREFNPIKSGVSFLDILANKSYAVDEEDVVVIDSSVFSLSNLIGRAVVGRTMGFKELRFLKTSLSKVGYEKANFQYLGGLSVLISFEKGDFVKRFLVDKEVWIKWFSCLNPWLGQSLPFERLAWVSIIGVPPHLVSRGVFDAIGSKYGKVVHPSQFLESDDDLSYDRLGILLDSGNRINGALSLSWQDKRYKVWVIEENNQWLPDFLEEDEVSAGVSSELGGNMEVPEGASQRSNGNVILEDEKVDQFYEAELNRREKGVSSNQGGKVQSSRNVLVAVPHVFNEGCMDNNKSVTGESGPSFMIIGSTV